MEKSSGAEHDAGERARRRRSSRRHWLGATLGAAAGGLFAEVASLAGTWDHERPARAPARFFPGEAQPTGPRLTHIGHACHLLELGGQRWLTDPWFFDPAFGSLWHRAALAPEAVGPLDGIFISHRHADHFDPEALRRLDKRAQVWTADPSLLAPLAQLGFERVSLSEPWRTVSSGALTVAFAPAVHDVPQHSLALLGTEARVLFCADTGPHQHWQTIRERYRPTTALLPCDGTRLRWEPRQIMNPGEAAAAALELGCRQLLPTHVDAEYSDLVAKHWLSATEPDPTGGLRRALEAAQARASGSLTLPEYAPLAVGETRALFSQTD